MAAVFEDRGEVVCDGGRSKGEVVDLVEDLSLGVVVDRLLEICILDGQVCDQFVEMGGVVRALVRWLGLFVECAIG